MTTQNDEQRPRCRANVYDKYSEESRPCMRRVALNADTAIRNVYCWQHSSIINRSYSGRSRSLGVWR